jgi:hypothetical protein
MIFWVNNLPADNSWLTVYWLVVYWLMIYWLIIYWLIVYRSTVYWLMIYWLIVYRLPIWSKIIRPHLQPSLPVIQSYPHLQFTGHLSARVASPPLNLPADGPSVNSLLAIHLIRNNNLLSSLPAIYFVRNIDLDSQVPINMSTGFIHLVKNISPLQVHTSSIIKLNGVLIRIYISTNLGHGSGWRSVARSN